MATPKVLFSLRSYRVIEAGGTDKAGRHRGVNIERRSGQEWKMVRFRTDAEEAIELVKRSMENRTPLR